MPLYLHFWNFLAFCLTKAVLCSAKCPDTRNIIGAEGSDITMPIRKDSLIEVIWVFKHRYIAKTLPNHVFEISDPAYKGRVDNEPGFSIIIKNVTKGDEGLYTANILRENTDEYEQLCYELKVYEKLSVQDLHIHHRISDRENCHLNLSCTMNRADVTVSWNNTGRGDTNVANITFLGNSPDTDSSYTCIAANPASSVSRTIIPRLVCAEDMNINSGVAGVLEIKAIQGFSTGRQMGPGRNFSLWCKLDRAPKVFAFLWIAIICAGQQSSVT